MNNSTTKSNKSHDFLIIAAVFTAVVIKHVLVVQLPVEARNYPIDDLLMVKMAEGLLSGKWLGEYSPYILMKGAFFPMLLALFNRIGISYLSAIDLLNSAACIFFTWQMRHLIKKKKLLLVLFVVLLYDPCSFSRCNFQRVYRSSIVEMQILFLFGSYFGLYFHELYDSPDNNRLYNLKSFGFSLFCGINLWASWNTREDSAWMIPFVVVASAIIFVCILKHRTTNSRMTNRVLLGSMILLLPLGILLAGNETISQFNLHYYGEHVRLEEVDGSFADALKTMYSIRNLEDVPYTSVTRKKLERCYEMSPTLLSIRPELEKRMRDYYKEGRETDDTDVEDGWFIWALKSAAYINGAAETLHDSQQFWSAVDTELQKAIDDPSQNVDIIKTMPSALMSPWRKEYAEEMPKAFLSAIKYLIRYKEVYPLVEPSGKASFSVTRRFEIMTNNLSMYSDEDYGKLTDYQKEKLVLFNRVLTGIGNIYRSLNPFAAVIGCLAYLFIALRMIFKKRTSDIPFLLVILGMGASAVVMVLGVCYTHISAFPAIKYFYLVGAYPLMLTCEWIPIIYTTDILFSRISKEHDHAVEND